MAVVVRLLIPELSELTQVLSILSTETAWGTSASLSPFIKWELLSSVYVLEKKKD